MHFIILLYACFVRVSSGQRYAERNVPPADTFPSSDNYNYGYEYGEDFGFEEEESDVYKWNVEDYPHPKNSSRYCNRLKPSHVCDPDMVLEKEHANYLDAYIRKLYRETPCICDSCNDEDGGIVVGIALLKHMYQPYNTHPAKVIRSFAEKLRTTWKLGKCDNDILIVVATTDRLSYTDVGRVTSEYLSIYQAHQIFLDNKAKFTAGNFFEGLQDILEGYYRATRVMEKMLAPKQEELNMAVVTGVIIGSVALLGILLFVGFVLYRRFRRNKMTNDEDSINGKGEGFSSKSWSKRDIKVLFSQEKTKPVTSASTKYQPCRTEDNGQRSAADEEEVIDFTLATPSDTSFANEMRLTNRTSDSEALEKDLAVAAEGIVKTFPSKSGNNVLTTDM